MIVHTRKEFNQWIATDLRGNTCNIGEQQQSGDTPHRNALKAFCAQQGLGGLWVGGEEYQGFIKKGMIWVRTVDAHQMLVPHRGDSTIWDSDEIQFPRLLAELVAAGVIDDDLRGVEDSMDLPAAKIKTLFQRAERTWEGYAAQLGD